MSKKCLNCNSCLELHYDVNLQQSFYCDFCNRWFTQNAEGVLSEVVKKPVLQGKGNKK
jgi:hypothetical protein